MEAVSGYLMATNGDKRVSYRDLHQSPEAAFKRAQDGLRACKATLVLLQQTATVEENFGTALIKVSHPIRRGVARFSV